MAHGSVLFASAALVLGALVSVAVLATTSSATTGTSWTVYHGDPAGSGLSLAIKAVNTSHPKWQSTGLDGALYGEPLVYGNDVYVATENDTIYALSATNGHVVWSRHLATPVPSSDLPCGDISPVEGITGTPVIDPSRNELFAVAFEMVGGHPEHMLVGVNATTGALKLRRDVDPPGAVTVALLQRTGLTLDNGRVIFGYGGNDGDCAAYRGRIVSVPETGGPTKIFTVDGSHGDSQGAIWMGGAAPAVDAKGDVWVSAGNGSVNSSSQPFDDSDSVLELSSTMHLDQYFAPTSWPQNNAADLDMSMEPALLSNGQVVIAGKSEIIYLLNGHHLGGIGHQQSSLDSGCQGNVDGGGATVGTTVYLPCVSGTVAVRVSSKAPALRLLWSTSNGGGSPIVAAGLVWTIGQNGVLYGLSPASGAIRQQVSIGQPVNHFPTPSVGDGLLLAPTANTVVAFSTTAS